MVERMMSVGKMATESLEPGETEKYVCVLRALNPERDVSVKTLP